MHVVGMRAEDLARREVDDALERVTRGKGSLEHVVRADHVHAHRQHRVLAHGVDAGDRGAVDDVRRALGHLGDMLRIEDITVDEGEVRVLSQLGRC